MSLTAKNFKVGLLQLNVGKSREKNVRHAVELTRQVVKDYSPRVVVLPECFTGPYATELFADYAEFVPNGHTCKELSKTAADLDIYLIGGSIIEKDSHNKLYNTCTVWDPEGNLIGKHRKVHLADAFTEKLTFQESSVLTPGSDFTIVEIDGRRVGIGICNDSRFNEMALIYRKQGCEMIIYPSAFDVNLGPLFWETIQRSRASDYQMFVASVSTARDEGASYVAYGHTMVADPVGRVICEASEKEEVLVVDIDFSLVEKTWKEIPLFEQRRLDLYDFKTKNYVS